MEEKIIGEKLIAILAPFLGILIVIWRFNYLMDKAEKKHFNKKTEESSLST